MPASGFWLVWDPIPAKSSQPENQCGKQTSDSSILELS
jgi:hypothetical protein